MYQTDEKGIGRRLLFGLLDLLCLVIAYHLCFLVREGHLPGDDSRTVSTTLMIVWLLADVAVMFANNTLQDIFNRNKWQELLVTARHTLILLVCIVAYVYFTKTSISHSRFTMFFTPVCYCGMTWFSRCLVRKLLREHRTRNPRSVLLICPEARAAQLADLLETESHHRIRICAVSVPGGCEAASIRGIPVLTEAVSGYVCREWVDEVLFDRQLEDPQLESTLYDMGIAVHKLLYEDHATERPCTVESLAGCTVTTSCIRLADWRQLFLKRLMDIAGGLVGTLITGVLFLFVAPQIKSQSPGPVFFRQERIGRNGRKFYMYKFRSMYLDAEERKQEMLAKNNYSDNLMFKMDDDPRIIGGQKGIGGFIRRTSIDEFPQFFNVLRGDMSLVGTRPPTADEWARYSLHHRSRMAVKPGITGMWQVSGRSSITDFDQVVALDRKYIENWSLGLDIHLLFKTVQVVFTRKGAQ